MGRMPGIGHKLRSNPRPRYVRRIYDNASPESSVPAMRHPGAARRFSTWTCWIAATSLSDTPYALFEIVVDDERVAVPGYVELDR